MNNQRNRTRFNCRNGGDCQLEQRESWSGDTFGVWNFHRKNNVYFAVFAVPFTQSYYCLSLTCQLCSVTHCRNGCMRKCGCFFLKTKTKTAGVTHRHYDLCFSAAWRNLLYSWNYEFQRSIRLENDRVVHSYKAAKALVPERGLR